MLRKMLRYLVVVSLALVATTFAIPPATYAAAGLSEKLARLLEKIKLEMPCGFPDSGIPPLTPFKHEYAELKHDNVLFSFLSSFSNIQVDGLNNFVTNEVSFSALTLKSTFDITLKTLITTGEHSMKLGLLRLLNIHRLGEFTVALNDLRIQGELQLASKDQGLYVKDLKTVVVLGDFKSNVTGLIPGRLFQKFANYIVEDMVIFFIKYFSGFLSEIVREVTLPIVNEQLKDFTTLDLLNIINSADEPVKCVTLSKSTS